MADVKLIIEEPNISFNSHTSGLQCGVQRDPTPVVVMGVTTDRDDIARDIGRPVLGIASAGAVRGR